LLRAVKDEIPQSGPAPVFVGRLVKQFTSRVDEVLTGEIFDGERTLRYWIEDLLQVLPVIRLTGFMQSFRVERGDIEATKRSADNNGKA
jgi:hypothetical protein